MSPGESDQQSGNESVAPSVDESVGGETIHSEPGEASGNADGVVAENLAPLRVTGFGSGGEGVGRMEDGRVVFVDGAIPGDLVELTDWTMRKKLARARVGKILEPSPDRIEPRCVHFGHCGGCRWQNLRYEAQLDAKRGTIRDALKRIGGISLEKEIEIVASPDPYGYRARARLVETEGRVGYRIRGTRNVEPIEVCPILTPLAEDGLASLIGSLARDGSEPSDSTPAQVAGKRRPPVEWTITAGSIGPVIIQEARGKRGTKTNDDYVSIEVLGESLRANAKSFIQGNALLWNALGQEVIRQCLVGLDSGGPKKFIELYAGIGFLTIPLARRGLSGVAIESDRFALSDLTFNLEEAGLSKQVKVIRSRVESRGDLAKRFSEADLLLVDPPRVGLEAKVREAIMSKGPARVVYVSCDPATLARDLKKLVGAGYRLSSIRAMDLFPQTPHVETVSRLDRVK